MNSRRKISVLILTIALTLILINGSIQSNQVASTLGKPDVLFPGSKSRSEQENKKYLYVGAEKCASVCHNNDTMGYQSDIWNNSPHRESFKILVSKRAEIYARKAHLSENPQKSQVCLRCHVTGAGLDSSFFASTYKKDDGVTCEACHKSEFISKTFLPKEADCIKCHNNSVHKTDKFNFREGCAKTAHPRPKKLNLLSM
ncbi:MAG: multiheme c-type cytochrome [Bacteroidota bacterium]